MVAHKREEKEGEEEEGTSAPSPPARGVLPRHPLLFASLFVSLDAHAHAHARALSNRGGDTRRPDRGHTHKACAPDANDDGPCDGEKKRERTEGGCWAQAKIIKTFAYFLALDPLWRAFSHFLSRQVLYSMFGAKIEKTNK